MLVLTVSKDLTDRYKAGDLIKGIAQMLGGSGGGRPDMAQAGGHRHRRSSTRPSRASTRGSPDASAESLTRSGAGRGRVASALGQAWCDAPLAAVLPCVSRSSIVSSRKSGAMLTAVELEPARAPRPGPRFDPARRASRPSPPAACRRPSTGRRAPRAGPWRTASARTATPSRAASSFELREHPPRRHTLDPTPVASSGSHGGARKTGGAGKRQGCGLAGRHCDTLPVEGCVEATMTAAPLTHGTVVNDRYEIPPEPRQGWHGRGVPRVRPHHPAAGRPQDRSRRVAHARRRRGAAAGAPARPLGEPPERVPRPRPGAQPVRPHPRDGVHHGADAPHAHPSQEGPGRLHLRRVPAHRARLRLRRRGHPRAGARPRGPQARQRHGDDQRRRLVRQGHRARLRLRQGTRARLGASPRRARPTAARRTT